MRIRFASYAKDRKLKNLFNALKEKIRACTLYNYRVEASCRQEEKFYSSSYIFGLNA